MRFELHGEDTKLDDGRPMSIGKTFTLSNSPKGNLRPFMEGWRGKAFTDEDFEAFDLQNMLQKPAIESRMESTGSSTASGVSMKELPPECITEQITPAIDWEKTGVWMADKGMPLETTYSVQVKVKPMKASPSVE